VGRGGAGRVTLSGQFNGKTPSKRVNCFESHTQDDTTDTILTSQSQTSYIHTHRSLQCYQRSQDHCKSLR
jgi:hypothetical protein